MCLVCQCWPCSRPLDTQRLLMAGCSGIEYNCHPTPKRPGPPVVADPDIAGPGVSIGFAQAKVVVTLMAYADRIWKVLIAFAATSVIAFIVITVAYLLNIIPKKCDLDTTLKEDQPVGLLNDFDEAFIRCCSPFWRWRKGRSRRASRIEFKALQRFVLTLSDQQLVTGLAIFSIGYYRHCTISTYHFFIIVALGWFSHTTHLSSLIILQDHFRKSPGLKYTRLLGILATFVLLFIGLLLLYTRFSFQVLMQCRFRRIYLGGKAALNTLCMVMVLCYIILITLSKTWALYSDRRTRLLSLFNLLDSRAAQLEEPVLSRPYLDSRAAQLEEPVLSRPDYYQRRVESVAALHGFNRVRTMKRYWIMFNFAYAELLDSFLFEILLLLFNNFYGIRQIFWARKFVGDSITRHGNENSWGFGQLLALLLLALPVLAALEAYHGESCSWASERANKLIIR